MSGFVHGGKFEQSINQMCSPENIARTAKKFVELEKQYGAYTFGKFAKFILPDASDWEDRGGSTEGYNLWEKDSGALPDTIRKRLAEVISANLKSASPLPVVLKVTDNVDTSNELTVKMFVHKNVMHMGLLLLCPNPELK
jgi:hypothetical protein